MCGRAVWWPCRPALSPSRAVLALRWRGAGRGPSAAGGGSPARCAQTLTAGSKTVTPDLFSLQLNLSPD